MTVSARFCDRMSLDVTPSLISAGPIGTLSVKPFTSIFVVW